MDGKLVLLTGAPATGKTTLSRILKCHVKPLLCLDFGQWLLKHVKTSKPQLIYQTMRTKSSMVISPVDVSTIDKLLLKKLNKWRSKTNVIIDSHAVTKENFGFRVTASSFSLLQKLSLDAVVVLHTDPRQLVSRISNDPNGRLKVGVNEAKLHQSLQESIALVYGVLCGCPVFILDTGKFTLLELAKNMMKLLESIGMTYKWVE